jgi:nitrite reductase/ring-hydroxylating ferredoxin subunit
MELDQELSKMGLSTMDVKTDVMNTPYNGYFRSGVATEDAELTHTDPGTPCGEYLRRYWQPICMSKQLTDLPMAVRIMGEDLVVFRDHSGDVGLLHRQCSHRRTSLEYGVVAEHGIRCCYHGWLFDVDGTILETPGEPDDSPIRHTLSHGAYPALEYKGLVFAYMGPPEKKPEFPIYDTMDLPGDEMVPYALDMPCNWLQVTENPMDPIHSVFLHTRVTRAQFNPAWGAKGILEWHRMKERTGIYLTNTRRWNEYIWTRTAESWVPNFAQPPDVYQDADREKFFPRAGITKWVVPVDNTHCKLIAWRHYSDKLDLGGKGDKTKVGLNSVDFVGQTEGERSYEEGQREPSDFEAQVGQGPITVHKLEHLGWSDTGVAMLRVMLKRGIRDLKKGIEPPAPVKNADGLIPTMSGDVIIKVGKSNVDDHKAQEALGKKVGKIVVDTLPLAQGEREAEIEKRVRKLLA